MLLFNKIKEKKINIFFIILISLCIGVICSINISSKEYVSTSTLLLIKTENKDNNQVQKIGNLELSTALISTFKEILKSDENLSKSKINDNISNNEFKKKIELKRISNSDTFQIKVKNREENVAKNQNEKLVDIFSNQIENLYSNVEVNIIDNPHIEKYSYSINIVLPVIIALLVGIIIGLIYIIILIIIEKNKKIYLKIEKELNLKKLAEIPLKLNKKEKNSKSELIAYESEKSKLSKSFKNLRSNIQFINVNNNGKNIILITSPLNLEGKSFVTANLAISFAEAGKKVVLIDSDMINGRQSQIFNVPNNLGFSNYLSRLDSSGMEIKKLTNNFIHETAIKNLNLITSGTIPPNPTELLSSDSLDQLIKDLSIFYDIVIIDGTSILSSMDSLILARKANSTIIVSDYKKTKTEDLLKTKKDIQNVGGRPIGIIINKIKLKKSKQEIKNDFDKIKSKIKEDLKKLLQKINQIRENSKQKLLEEAEKVEQSNAGIIVDDIEENIINENCNKEKNETNDYIDNKYTIKKSSKNIFSKIKFDKKIKDEKILEDNQSELDKLENFEEKQDDFEIILEEDNSRDEYNNGEIEELKEEDKEEKTKKLEILKDNFSNVYNKIKEKTINTFYSVKSNIESKIKNTEINENKQELEEKQSKFETTLTDDNENQKSEISENRKKTKNNKKKSESEKGKKSKNSILIIVDAERAYCRVFSEYCFAEKNIKGIDKVDGFKKDQYSIKLVTSRREGIMNVYGLTKDQVKRIDPLIYITLCDYDDTVWLERKMISNKAEAYVLIMAKEYEKMLEETEQDFNLRIKRLRKEELKKLEIEIEYKLNNMWKTPQISIVDKLMLQYFSNLYDLKKEYKSEEELNKSNENIAFYEEVIIKAENRLKKISNEESKKAKEKSTENIQYEKIKEETLRSEEEKKRLKEEREKKKEEKKQKRQERREFLAQKKQEKIKEQEELKKQREEEKERQKEEARIEEELLGDNLYPKTKNNRNI